MEMYEILLLIVFFLGYTFIAVEHNIKLDKTASALLTGVLCWTIFIVSKSNKELINEELLHHLAEISSILFFLMGAMTIVELIGGFGAFDYIKHSLNIKTKSYLLVILSFITFFLSAILDNLTTSIVMSTIILNLLENKKDRLYFAGIIVIVANAGGAWSPMGDVTTTMLWIGGQIGAFEVVKNLLIPSLVVAIIPLLIAVVKFRGEKLEISKEDVANTDHDYIKQGKQMLYVGIAVLIVVPIFKTLTHLPPFMGMMLSLGVMWVITSILSYRQHRKGKATLGITVQKAMEKADMPSILFFLGILLAVSALQSSHLLTEFATYIDNKFHNIYIIGSGLGVVSAIVDNVPLVAAAQKMYDFSTYPANHSFWHFLALTTGVGGSMIIIGSAAGVAIMGKIKIEFMWYLKNISWLALVGFIAGIITFMLLH